MANKKKAAKPAVAKKEIVKEVKQPAKVEVTIKKEVLGEVPEEYHFVLADGKKLKSLFDLANAFSKMGDEIFKHHANSSRNDFSNWINDVFKLPDLAKEISAINNQLDAEVCVLRKLIGELKGGMK